MKRQVRQFSEFKNYFGFADKLETTKITNDKSLSFEV